MPIFKTPVKCRSTKVYKLDEPVITIRSEEMSNNLGDRFFKEKKSVYVQGERRQEGKPTISWDKTSLVPRNGRKVKPEFTLYEGDTVKYEQCIDDYVLANLGADCPQRGLCDSIDYKIALDRSRGI